MHLVGCTIRAYYDARTYERKIYVRYLCLLDNDSRITDTCRSKGVKQTFRHILPDILYYVGLKNSVALFRKRTIPTERPPPVGEVSANFCG